MNYSSNDEARLWAENLAESEGEAFEQAIKRIKPNEEPKTASKMLTMPFNVSDEIEQAYRQGYIAASIKMAQENAELRAELNEQEAMIHRLRECIARNNEDFYD